MWKNRRKKTIVDRKFQFRMVRRLIFHWTCFVSALMTLLIGWHLIVGVAVGFNNGQPTIRETMMRYAPVLFALWVMLPVLVWDILKLSHGIVGPIIRLRMTIQALNRGEEVKKVKLRKGDYCIELADDLNMLIEKLNTKTQDAARVRELLMTLPDHQGEQTFDESKPAVMS